MPTDALEIIEYLKEMREQQNDLISTLKASNQLQEETITSLKAMLKQKEEQLQIKEKDIEKLLRTVDNLNGNIEQLRRALYGTSSEKTRKESTQKGSTGKDTQTEDTPVSKAEDSGETITVKGYTRQRNAKRTHDDLYAKLPVKEVQCPLPEGEDLCPYCNTKMIHLGYKQSREELEIIPAKIQRIRYMVQSCMCPACQGDGDTTIVTASAPTALIKHSPVSPSAGVYVIYQKSGLELPFYRQEMDFAQKGAVIPRETQANWYITLALEYFQPVYERLHEELLRRDLIHADEVPCQVLHEENRDARTRSYMWVYLTGTDGKPGITLYDYEPGRSGDYPIEFLAGFAGLIQCDGYSGYGRIDGVVLVVCLAHCRRKFYDAIPAARRRQLKLLDINSEEQIREPSTADTETEAKKTAAKTKTITSAEIGLNFCNRLFYIESQLKEMDASERKAKREELEVPVWNEFWTWLDGLVPAGGSKLEKAVNYARNHRETLMNYLLDGRCEISNNAAERRCKKYVMGRKNFLFHNSVNGAKATAIMLSIIETAKMNNLNVYQYLYTVLLYMVDYKNEPAAIELLLPWSTWVQEHCTGLADVETIRPENRGKLPV